MNNFFFTIFICFVTATSAAGSESCYSLFIDNENHRLIKNLANLRAKLDQSKALNSNSLAINFLATKYEKKEKDLATHFQVSLDTIKIWIKSEIENLKTNKQEELDEATSDQMNAVREVYVKQEAPVFNRVEEGIFPNSMPSRTVFSFYLSATPITQVFWRRVAEMANKFLRLNEKINVDPSSNKGEFLPVESVTPTEVDRWIIALNKLIELQNPEIKKFIPDLPEGYRFRLPTFVEWEFVLTKVKTNREIIRSKDPIALKNLFWFKDNSSGSTQPVGQKIPIGVDGREFHDMIGNVMQMTSGDSLSGGRIVQGASYKSNAEDIERVLNFIEALSYDQSEPYIGFRLVRSR